MVEVQSDQHLHDEGDETSLILPGDAISTLIFFWEGVSGTSTIISDSSCLSMTFVPSPPAGKTQKQKLRNAWTIN